MPNYSGMWTSQAQMQAKAKGLWTLSGFNTLWSWGDNSQGVLGLNDIANRSSPVQVGALAAWSNVSTGGDFCLATKTDGTLWSWGWNAYGQLGQNIVNINRSSPVQIGALTTWSNIAGGASHTIATKTDGTLWAWGFNGNGGLGDNTAINRSSPVQIGSLTTWSNVAGGKYSSLATKTDGTLWTWGRNSDGQLSLNDTVFRSSPVQVGALTTWLNIAAGNYSCLATKTDGTLWSWGQNNSGQLGLNDTAISRSSPVQVGALTTWSKASAGVFLSIAIQSS